MGITSPVFEFLTESRWADKVGDPDIADFMVGNPQEPPLPEFTAALQKWAVPQNKDWFAYTENDPTAQRVVAESLVRRLGQPFQPEDIFLTNGAFSGITVTLTTIVDPGDEVIFVSPPWFFYESLIAAEGAIPVRVKCDPETYDLDLDAIEEAASSRTRAIIINSPNNPTGKIYPPETLQRLADLLTRLSEKIGHTIYLISDEAYSRIIFDGRDFSSPTAYYPNSFLIYTYGKTLLTPGQRLGYIALPPAKDRSEQFRMALMASQVFNGFAFPNALLQHALPDIEPLSIDIPRLQRKRDRLVGALREIGYDVTNPEGTFYILGKSPIPDDAEFTDRLADHNVYCLPGTVFEMPGFFRISTTATEEMIENALPGFKTVFDELASPAKTAASTAS